jgi:hypothetical protein
LKPGSETLMVTEENKELARMAVSAFGKKWSYDGSWSIVKYRDANEELAVDILSCFDSPTTGINSYSTIGLSDYPMHKAGKEFGLRLEVAGMSKSSVEWFPNLLSSVAFYVMRTGRLCAPGFVWQNAVEEYASGLEMRHLYFTAPFMWGDTLGCVQLTNKKVAWLLAVPTSEAEYKYRKKYGDHSLEHLLEIKDVDFFDVERPSVV